MRSDMPSRSAAVCGDVPQTCSAVADVNVHSTNNHVVHVFRRLTFRSIRDGLRTSLAQSDIGEPHVPVYGLNIGYRGQAGRLIVDGSEEARLWVGHAISEAIVAIDVSVGPPFDIDVVRAGMLLRINMLLGGVSGVKLGDLDLLRRLLNLGLTPYVQQYGGVHSRNSN
jgi:histidine ammonia-lyase